jgi:hypothetical protein
MLTTVPEGEWEEAREGERERERLGESERMSQRESVRGAFRCRGVGDGDRY